MRGVDRKPHEFIASAADEFVLGDLRDAGFCNEAIDRRFDEVYQLAAEMGGAEFIYSGAHDADIMRSSMQIDLNVLEGCRRHGIKRVFFPSSACVYPTRNQLDAQNPNCAEDSVYPAAPDSEYGWTKLFGERLYLSYARDGTIEPRIARYHNIFGPQGAWRGGREKAPAALCRKIAEASNGGTIEIWGDGQQSRSFLFVSEAVEGTLRLMRSDVSSPVNIGSEELVTIDQLADLIASIAGKSLSRTYVAGPVGVRGRNSDNRLIRRTLGWSPSMHLRDGLERTYAWIASMVRQARQ